LSVCSSDVAECERKQHARNLMAEERLDDCCQSVAAADYDYLDVVDVDADGRDGYDDDDDDDAAEQKATERNPSLQTAVSQPSHLDCQRR
jgi:hypothetical protein